MATCDLAAMSLLYDFSKLLSFPRFRSAVCSPLYAFPSLCACVRVCVCVLQALKVIKGSIDQVAGEVRLTWVSPRVLDKGQIKQLQDRLAVWQGDVEQATHFVEANAQHVL